MLLNLLQLLQSDDQTTYTDKVNYNFDQILSMGGGPIGPTGFNGIQGVPGNQGVQGFQGEPGLDGARWYVLPSSSTPSIPTPRINDLWLQTDTLHIFEYLGSPATWVDLGFSLSSTGVFKSGGASDLLFTNPSATRSLVLSPIDYGVGNDSPGSSYKLKIVGNSASPMLRFAIDDGGSENSIPAQATLGIQKIVDPLYITTAGINWRTNFDNNGGDFFLNTSGNYFAMYPQISSVGRFDFGSQTRLQNSATSRLLSFASSNTGTEFFNIGRHSGITNAADNLFTINDKGQVGFNNTVGTVFTPINLVGATDFHIDVINEALGTTALAKNNWLRLRGKARASWDTLQIDHNRLWADSVGSSRSAMIRLQHYTTTTLNHFIGFTGGSDSSAQPIQRAQLRLGYGDNYYFSGDINGRIGIGDSAFIQKYNSLTTNFKSKLQIQGNDSSSGGLDTSGFTAFSGIHLIPQNFTGGTVGISAGGIGSFENGTYAGLHFQDQSGGVDQGMDLHLTTGLYASGSVRRFTIDRNGDSRFWSKNNPWHFLFIEPGGLSGGGVTYPTDFIKIGSYDWTSNWKSIVFSEGSDYAGFGDGFLGIGGGSGFGDDITSGSLEQNMWYLAKGPVVYNDGSAISVISGVSFKVTGASATLTSGTVSRAKPATKLHVAADGVTFGTRRGGAGFSTYSGNVGQNSFTVGNTHKASGIRSIILGGAGHTVTGNDTTLIGFSGSGITVPDANIVQLGTVTHVSKSSPFVPTIGDVVGNGPNTIYSPSQYIYANSPILNIANSVNVNYNIFVLDEIGTINRVLSLESVSNTSRLANIPVAIEFSSRNNVNISKQIGLIAATHWLTNPNNILSPTAAYENGRISFFVNQAGDMVEKGYFHSGGFNFVTTALNVNSVKLSVDPCKDLSVSSGGSLSIKGGDAATLAYSAGVGGNVNIDAGFGTGGGGAPIGGPGSVNGVINIGALSPARINMGNNTTTVTHVQNIVRVDNDIVTGTDTAGWVYYPIGQWATKQRLNTNGDWQSSVACNITGTNFQKSHFSYKIIGKTVYMSINVQLTGSAWGPNSGAWAIAMPQLNYKNYNAPDPNALANMDSIGWGDFGLALRLQPRKYLSSSNQDPWNAYGGNTPQWCVVVQRVDGSPGHNAAAIIRGQMILELN